MGEVVASTKPGRRLRKKYLLPIILVALLLVVILAWLIVTYTSRPAVNIGKGIEIGSVVQSLPTNQQEEVAKVNVLVPSQDMEWSYAKAVALASLDRQTDALRIYKSLDKTDKAPYYVYVQYASTAAESKDPKLAAKMFAKAIEKLEADASVNAYEKTMLKRRMAGTLEAYKEEVK